MSSRQSASMPATGGERRTPWHRRLWRTWAYSVQLRLVLVFLFLALGVSFIFVSGAGRAFSVGWREAARPLLSDYVDRLSAEVAPPGGPPDVERARALVQRLPITVHIDGPVVRWASDATRRTDGFDRSTAGNRGEGGNRGDLLRRRTDDGHVIEFGLAELALERRPRLAGYALAGLLLLTLAAFLAVRRLLRPLADIRDGAGRFGAGAFDQPIPVRRPARPDELGHLAAAINGMAADLREMLDAKRALLLAISHELRSPLTRARLNVELLPDSTELQPQREALLRDLREMTQLIGDLLESERLSVRHAPLQREPVRLDELARELIADLQTRYGEAAPVTLRIDGELPTLSLDAARIRLMLRNLLDNALRHGGAPPGAPQRQAPELLLRPDAGQGVIIEVRDFGPGVPEEQLARLAQAFYRPDSARSRDAGGVGLGLYLCRLVAQAHGGQLSLRNARPGLAVQVSLPAG
ncbi:MAG: ATP-binding protein [Burkholderiaceae bacterium]